MTVASQKNDWVKIIKRIYTYNVLRKAVYEFPVSLLEVYYGPPDIHLSKYTALRELRFGKFT